MLTRRTKANSSPGSVVAHRSTNRARRRVTSFQPKHVTNYATPPMSVPWRHLVNDIDLRARNCEKVHKTAYFGLQDHPRSLNSAPIESQYTISY